LTKAESGGNISTSSRPEPESAMKRAALVFALTLWTPVVLGQTAVVTYHYDDARTGQNIHERILTPTNVKAPDQFVRLFTHPVEGDVYAQPLYVPKVAVPGKGTHNVVFVATEADLVYAFDADNSVGANATYLWRANLLDSAHGAATGATTVCALPGAAAACSGDAGCPDTYPQYGITSTPVIDPETREMYVVTVSEENAAVVYRLHVLDIATGKEKSRPHSPGHKEITGMVNGITFQPAIQHNRPGLLLKKDKLYIAFGSHCDSEPSNPTPSNIYHGWIFAYDAETLSQKAAFLTTPNGYRGGIWMEGTGLAADKSGDLFVATGNGTFASSATNGFQDFGDSILKLGPNLEVPPKDYFTPFNQGQMDSEGPNLCFDADLGSGGVLLLPEQPGGHPHLLVQAGKVGTIYVVDRDNMGHFCATCTPPLGDTNIVQEITNNLRNTPVPVYWNNTVYLRGDQDVLRAFPINNGKLSTPPLTTPDPADSYSGRIIVSANGDKDGIVWSLNTTAAEGGGHAILNAYDAANLSQLYSSATNALRDDPGIAMKFTTPVVADGRVYVGTSGELAVFGLYSIRVEVTNVQLSNGKWCATVTAVDASGQPVAGTVTINRTTGPTNQQICFPPCSTRKTDSAATDREPSPCTGIVTIPGFPLKHIRVGPP
jgi:hypothetical protein